MGKYYIKLVALFLALVLSPLFAGSLATQTKTVEIDGLDMNPVVSSFVFSIEIPTKILSSLSSENSPILSADGHWNSTGDTWEEEFKFQLDFLKKKGAQVTYQSFKKDSFVIVGSKDDKVIYEKEVLLPGNSTDIMDNTFLRFQGEYLKKDRKIWDEVMKTCVLLKKINSPISPIYK